MDATLQDASCMDSGYAEIGAKIAVLFLHLVTLPGPFPMPDGSELEFEDRGETLIMINHSANGHHTYIYHSGDTLDSISYADGRDLHELQLKPGQEPSYQNGDTGAVFPKQEFIQFLDTAIASVAPPA